MKIFDLVRIAVRNMKGRWMVLPVAGIAISMFCICFIGAVLTEVNQEKSLPYELNVSSESANITDSVIVQISETPDVTAATPVYKVPVTIKLDEYSAQLTLTGINAAYLNEEFSQGGVFPDSSVMPYIVLNQAACKQFSNEENSAGFETETDTLKVDWLNTNVYVQMNEGSRPIVSKISGVLKSNEEEQEPAAYISISSAKELLRQSGQSMDYSGASVRVTNIGYAKSVSQSISALGLNVSNSNEELQAKWDMEMKEVTYLIVIGAFCLLCSAVLMAVWRKISRLEQRETYETLKWIGFKEKDVNKLYAIEFLLASLIGITIGITVSTSLPSFLSLDRQAASIFLLPIPWDVVALGAAVCVIAGMVPLLGIKTREKNL